MADARKQIKTLEEKIEGLQATRDDVMQQVRTPERTNRANDLLKKTQRLSEDSNDYRENT